MQSVDVIKELNKLGGKWTESRDYKLSDLLNGNKKITSKERGIYVVYAKDKGAITFADPQVDVKNGKIFSTNGAHGKYSASNLNEIFKSNGSNIIYIGKASGNVNELGKRLRQYINTLKKILEQKIGKTVNHAGGRAVAQIERLAEGGNVFIKYYEFEPTGNAVNDAKCVEEAEKELIKTFGQCGNYPVANRRR